MKKLISLLLALCLLVSVTGCKSKEEKAAEARLAQWQEQYDLGVRYLEEGNYEEAILAFTAAIEIDPRRDDVYALRGEAYRDHGDLDRAVADFETAIRLKDDYAPYYDTLADIHIRNDDQETAAEVLEDGTEKTDDEAQKSLWDAMIEELTGDRAKLEKFLESKEKIEPHTIQRYYRYTAYESGYVDAEPEVVFLPFGVLASAIHDFDGDGTLELFTAEVVRFGELWFFLYQVVDGEVQMTGSALATPDPGNFSGALGTEEWEKIYLKEHMGVWYVFYEAYGVGKGYWADGQMVNIFGARMEGGILETVLQEYQAGSGYTADDPALQPFVHALFDVGLIMGREKLEKSEYPDFAISEYNDVFLLAAMTQTYSGEEDARAFMEALDNQNLAPLEITIEPNLEVKLPK